MSNPLLLRWRALKCKHTETVPTVNVSRKGRKSVAFQCVTCGKCAKEVRKNRSGYDAEKLSPFDHEFKERQRQARAELHTQMWNEAKSD